MGMLWPILLGYLDTLGAPWFLILLALVFTACLLWSFAALKKSDTRAAIRADLDRRKAHKIYGRIMARTLRRLYRWLTPRTVAEANDPFTPATQTRAQAFRLARAGWSWPILDKALLLAVVYPFLALALYWILTGNTGQLGALVVFPEEPRLWPRAALFGALALLLLRGNFEQSLASSRIGVMRRFSRWTQPVSFAGALAVAFAVALAVAFVVAFAGASTLALALAFALAFAVAWATRHNRAAIGYAGLLFGGFAGLFAAPVFAGPNLSSDSASLLILFGLLPLVNGVFDFISYGATLRLARWGLRGTNGARALFAGIVDLGLALILFTGLGIALLCGIAGLTAASGTQVFDIAPLFDSLRSDRAWADNWWLFVMLFSTAIPTLIHLCIAGLAAPGLLGPKPRRWLLGQMDRVETSLPATVLYHGGMAMIWTLGIMVPVLIVSGLVVVATSYLPLLGGTYLQVFEVVARWLGLIDAVGPGYLPPAIWV